MRGSSSNQHTRSRAYGHACLGTSGVPRRWQGWPNGRGSALDARFDELAAQAISDEDVIFKLDPLAMALGVYPIAQLTYYLYANTMPLPRAPVPIWSP